MKTTLLTIEPDLNLSYLNYLPTEDTVYTSLNPHENQVLVMTIGLKGCSYFQMKDKPDICFNANHTTINSFHQLVGNRCYIKDQRTEQIRLIVGKSILQRYFGEEDTQLLFSNNEIKPIAYQTTSPICLSYATTLANSICQKNHHPLKLHIHCLNLLAEQLMPILSSHPRLPTKLSQLDIAKLEQAHTILLTEYALPLTEAYLCLKVGLNKNKLKQGFSILYNTTPSKMLLAIRMQKAHLLLESGCQVSQAAWQVGYLYHTNFSLAFSRYFGYSPKEVFKST